jgi:type I restriction-modification system DNA methylase subunit
MIAINKLPGLDPYSEVYTGLLELREVFHRSGRLDDANAKLDEVTKVLTTYLAFKNGAISKFPDIDQDHLVETLENAFKETAELDSYAFPDGSSIFGNDPKLALTSKDTAVAKQIIQVSKSCVDVAFAGKSAQTPIDILNEAFGHFIRDNFRGNIEDAQYLTPPEVVDFMSSIVLSDLEREDPKSKNKNSKWIVADPTCGVGSFLASFYSHAAKSSWLKPKNLQLIGQDKVERMARLSTVNASLFDVRAGTIFQGNSLDDTSPISAFNNQVDVILTNPPFGAMFDSDYLKESSSLNLPFLSGIRKGKQSIDSSLLFVESNLSLLREGGRLLIVLPDSVVSARGLPSMLRHYLGRTCVVKAIIDLPSVTFAQAGTRTKTSILYLQKTKPTTPYRVFFASTQSLGFEVSSKKGVQVKNIEGSNDLISIANVYQNNVDLNDIKDDPFIILNKDPSCTSVSSKELDSSHWTPSHYGIGRITAVKAIHAIPNTRAIPLSELVTLYSESRRSEISTPTGAFISVLHIISEGLIDSHAAISNNPITPGIPVNPGELLFSKINPRIPRLAVVPNFDRRTLCSSEFEVMKPNDGYDTATIAYLLMLPNVQAQIQSMTSGTSASHNRIRSAELSKVLLPVPKKNSPQEKKLRAEANRYKTVLNLLESASLELASLRSKRTSD